MQDSFIKLDRSLLRHRYFSNPNTLKVWLWCLMKASHKPHKCLVGSTTVDLEIGSFVYGRTAAAIALNMSEQTLRTIIKLLERENKISIKSTNKFSVITVIKFECYQLEKYKANQQLTSNQPATNQQLTTNKNVKNEKKEKHSGKTPTGDHHFFIAWWNMAFHKVTGHKPLINGRTGKQVKTMLSSGISVKHLICYGAIVLTSEDDFYQKAGRTLAVLEGQLDSFKSKRNEYDIEHWRELGIMPPQGVELSNWNFMEAADETEATI